MLSSLQELLTRLDHAGELHRIDAPVSCQRELAAITRAVSAAPRGGTALLFQRPDGFTLPVATNLYGSRRRMSLALTLDHPDDLRERFVALLSPHGQLTSQGLQHLLAQHPELLLHAPIPVNHGPCHALRPVGDDLLQLPVPHNWPEDGSSAGSGRYLTLGQIHTVDPQGGTPNCGIYRCQIHDAHTLAIRWRPGSGAAQHYRQHCERGLPMPVAISLGGPPALTLAAAWPLPEGLDETLFAGWLRGGAIPLVACSHGPLAVPAEAELVIEGFAEPDQSLPEGPFGNHTGLYDPAGPAARVTVTRISYRPNAVLPATVVGPPPQEDCWMMLAWERLLAALLPRLVPGVRDIRIPLPWVFRQSAVISLENHSPRMVRETVRALWELPWFRKARLLVLVDAAEGPTQMLRAAWRVVNDTDWLDGLIHDEAGGRLAVDATCRHPLSDRLCDPEMDQLISNRWKEYGLP